MQGSLAEDGGMLVYHCDLCGARMSANDPNRYILKIEAFAAAGPVEITQEDLRRDHKEEIRRLLDTLSRQSQDQIEDSVYRAFRYDLCTACHAKFLRQPTPGLQGFNDDR
jgi:hypothetical protein